MRKGIALAVVTAVALLVPAGAAIAGDRDVIREGSCTRATDWKLKVSPEDGRLEVEFEVDQNVRGDRWRVRIRHDGDLVFRGVRTTRGPSGSFEVRDRREQPRRRRPIHGQGVEHFHRRTLCRDGDVLTEL
jgi:hypothetical protein